MSDQCFSQGDMIFPLCTCRKKTKPTAMGFYPNDLFVHNCPSGCGAGARAKTHNIPTLVLSAPSWEYRAFSLHLVLDGTSPQYSLSLNRTLLMKCKRKPLEFRNSFIFSQHSAFKPCPWRVDFGTEAEGGGPFSLQLLRRVPLAKEATLLLSSAEYLMVLQ